MAGNVSKPLTFSAELPDRIRSLDVDGFTVGHPSPEDAAARQSCVNHAGITYYWTAFKAAAGELKLGTYPGDGNDDRNIPGVGFQPDYVLVIPQGTGYVWQRSSAMPAGDLSYSFEGGSSPNRIQALQADGFQVGNSVDINSGGVTYHYAAWKATAGKTSVGSYTGDSVDGRSIAAGLRPGYVSVKRAVLDDAMMKPAATGTTTDVSLWFRCFANCTAANLIQSLENNGFRVGDDAAVNASGETYYWVAFGSDDCQPLSTTAAAGTLTVTAPGSFEMRFNTATGGSIDRFYDLAEDPARSTDLAGGVSNYPAFFYDAVLNGW